MSFQQGHALLIGVGTHHHHPGLDVPITVADGQAVQRVLLDANLCGYLPNQVQFLKEETATKAGILTALDNLNQLHATDSLFLFFAGHGSLGTDGNYYLLTHDVHISGNRVQAGTGVSDTELLNKLNAIPAKRLFMVFNACHSGHIATDTLAADELPKTLNPSGSTANALLGTGEGRILIVACREEQYSYIGPGTTTIFTSALIEGLKGQAGNNGGTISAFGLYEYLYHEVKEAVEDKYNRMQEPVLTVIKGVGPFPVALYRGASTLGEFADDSAALENTAVQEVSPRKVEQSFNRIINTGGGTYIGGSVNTGGGDFVGRDKVIHGDIVHGDKVGGDKVQGDKIGVKGDGTTAIGKGATAVGARGVHVSGDAKGPIITGDSNQVGDSYEIEDVEATNFAVGRGIKQSADQYGSDTQDIANAFAAIQTAINEASLNSAQKMVAQTAVDNLLAEADKGETADASVVEQWLVMLVNMAPDIAEVALDTFVNPIKGISTVFKKIAQKVQSTHN